MNILKKIPAREHIELVPLPFEIVGGADEELAVSEPFARIPVMISYNKLWNQMTKDVNTLFRTTWVYLAWPLCGMDLMVNRHISYRTLTEQTLKIYSQKEHRINKSLSNFQELRSPLHSKIFNQVFGKSPHPYHCQPSGLPNRSIFLSYLEPLKKFGEDEGHCRRKLKQNHNKTVVLGSCDHRQIW